MKPTSGKFVALAMIALACAAAAASFWYHRAAGAQALEFWGPEAARQIAFAPQVEACEVGERQAAAEGGVTLGRRVDASHARGLENIRRTLIEDSSYDWQQPRPSSTGRWRYRLRFSDGRGHADVWLSDELRAAPKADGPFARLTPEAYESLKGFFDDLLAVN